MKKLALSILTVLLPVIGTFGAPPLIAFERNNAVWIANLDGTGVKKIADGTRRYLRTVNLLPG